MSKRNNFVSIRGALEEVFTGILSAAIVAFTAGGTLAMCLPGILA